MGCYEDWWLFKRRDLNGKSFNSDDMSIENCAKFCLDYKYFGLQNKYYFFFLSNLLKSIT